MALTVRALLAVVAIVAGPAFAAPAEPLAPYAQLAGGCFKGAFPDGKAVDEHCWSWVYDGRHLRDVHVVTGSRPAYRGEAIYSWNAQRGRIVYRYWNSDGGYSDGEIEQRDGLLVSPEERYVGADGRAQAFRSSLKIIDADRYEARTETLKDGHWVEAWTIRFARSGATQD